MRSDFILHFPILPYPFYHFLSFPIFLTFAIFLFFGHLAIIVLAIISSYFISVAILSSFSHVAIMPTFCHFRSVLICHFAFIFPSFCQFLTFAIFPIFRHLAIISQFSSHLQFCCLFLILPSFYNFAISSYLPFCQFAISLHSII